VSGGARSTLTPPAFDWARTTAGRSTALRDLVIYEMSVRCFTASKSSGLDQDRRGTYLGLADKVRSQPVIWEPSVLSGEQRCSLQV